MDVSMVFKYYIVLLSSKCTFSQNPADCSKAKKVLCDLHKGCGFGCQIHHLTYCLITAYALGRTLVLDSHGWRYAPKGWESVFMPLSDTCRSIGSDTKTRWGCEYSIFLFDILLYNIPSLCHVKCCL